MLHNFQELRFGTRLKWYTFKEKAMMQIVWWLPKWVIYFAGIRLWANATTGKYGDTVAPEIAMDEVIKRWEYK